MANLLPGMDISSGQFGHALLVLFCIGAAEVVARFRAADFPLVALPVGFRLPRG